MLHNRDYGNSRIFYNREETQTKVGFLGDTDHWMDFPGYLQFIINFPHRPGNGVSTSRLGIIIRDGNRFSGITISQVDPDYADRKKNTKTRE
jgi:hypothetical protein